MVDRYSLQFWTYSFCRTLSLAFIWVWIVVPTHQNLISTSISSKYDTISHILNGGDIEVKVNRLEVAVACHQYSSKSTANEDSIKCQNGILKVSDGKLSFC